jgi:hypothetical protein
VEQKTRLLRLAAVLVDVERVHVVVLVEFQYVHVKKSHPDPFQARGRSKKMHGLAVADAVAVVVAGLYVVDIPTVVP